jgi:hypothetical protein
VARPLPRLGGPSLNNASTPASSTGISLTANAAVNTKAATWTELIASTVQDAGWLLIQLSPTSGTAPSYLVDIGVGASTAEQVLIPNIYMFQSISTTRLQTDWVFPVNIPAGTRISARSQSSIASATSVIAVQTLAPGAAGIAGLGRVEACGVVTGSSSLSPIDPGGTAHTDIAAPVQLIASTGFDYRWLNVCASFDAAGTGTTVTWLIDLMLGAAGSEVAIINDILLTEGAAPDTAFCNLSFPFDIPAGSRISARARSSINTATSRIVDVAVWGCG